jgi:hypothetical protein
MKNDWREDLQQALRDGERLENEADTLRVADLPFYLHPYPRELEWTVFNDTLETFKRHVKRVASRLGSPPDTTKIEPSGDEHTDARARWAFAREDGFTFTILVRVWWIEGCRVIKEGEEVTREPKLRVHPECVEVVDKLEDMQPEDWAQPVTA